ncbi:hypothetical protein K2X96_02815 [Patescibacteria group bacterium]|jgi:hypothetical protein|nr:hypothetical protein [Patescibacteria group bacterium]
MMSSSATAVTEFEIALERVKKGVAWLDEKAKTDPRFLRWRLMLMSIYGSRVSSLVKIEYNTHDPISLILREHPGLACLSDGRVKWATVKHAFFRSKHDGDPVELGFDSDNAVSAQALNHAWAQILSEYDLPTAIRHFP